jgi:hypothetical protein
MEWRKQMEQYEWDQVVAATLPAIEARKLIRKLRWIGLAEEAGRLQRASAASHNRQNGILAEIPYSTD